MAPRVHASMRCVSITKLWDSFQYAAKEELRSTQVSRNAISGSALLMTSGSGDNRKAGEVRGANRK
jgi:hypothetical protein